MAEQSVLQCKKQDHQNLRFLNYNMSSENKENLLICPICAQLQFLDINTNHKKNQKTILIDQLLNDQLKCENIIVWSPIQEKNHQEIFKNYQQYIKEFGIERFQIKFQEFEQEKIDIDQLFDYKQQQNCKIYNNQDIYETLQGQYDKVQEVRQELEIQFSKIYELVESFRKYKPIIKIRTKYQSLKFYKSDRNFNFNKGNFEIDNETRTIKYKTNQLSYIYSENLQEKIEYHLRFTMDTKNNEKQTELVFSLTSGDFQDSKDLRTDQHIYVFNGNDNSQAKRGVFQIEGKKNFYEFFKDKQTIINVVLNIKKKTMEIYDDDKISYQKLNFKKYTGNNFGDWILGITYKQYINNEQVDIQFMD
ncbi:hypothetical protein PPERSA_06129 [Pseudocohnilembus persalinus]|uniref:Uncharacterized protein n=1 Tax=Pseudocohnilembus persalinus TaxID=266149 RepID=A0A0V0QVF9_PSEPJ|nr:hypothetical protein PPERSA_06129 [Pseudocohnilembus persalinus]|eukprot:KRX06247.1 hypothetical protein PPERSA_06129 [Pseudocohnilembus persalinus]